VKHTTRTLAATIAVALASCAGCYVLGRTVGWCDGYAQGAREADKLAAWQRGRVVRDAYAVGLDRGGRGEGGTTKGAE